VQSVILLYVMVCYVLLWYFTSFYMLFVFMFQAERTLKRYDADRDGNISSEEWHMASPSRV